MKDLVHRRGGSENWYVRVQIPLESQAVLGKKEIWRTLRTTDLKQARKLAHAKIAEIQGEIEIALKSAPKKATRADLEDAVRRFYLGEVESDQNERSYDIEFVRERLARDPQRYRKYVDELRMSLAAMDFDVVGPDAEHVLDMENLQLSKNSPLYMEFLHLLMRARVEAAKRWAEHDQAIFGEEPKDKFFRIPPKPLSEETPKKPGSPTILSIYEKYASARAATIKTNTIDERRNTVLRFSQFVGLARDPGSITRGEARAWRDLLKEWPQYADQAKDFAGQDFRQVLETNKRVGRPATSIRTANKYITDLSSFFDWLVREDYVEKNLFKELSLEAPETEQPVQPFSDRQLSHLFDSPLFKACRDDNDIRGIAEDGQLRIRDWRYWLPILSLFSGARLGEIAQLEVADIQVDGDIHFFYFTNEGMDPEKSLKTRLSKRRVPIHTAIIALGFLDYVGRVSATGATSLFPELKRDTKGHFSTASKFFQRYFAQIKLRKVERFSTNFHSFRHNFIDELRLKYPQDETFKSLLGHAGKSVTTGYGVREVLALSRRQELVESVVYAGANLTSLHLLVSSSAKDGSIRVVESPK